MSRTDAKIQAGKRTPHVEQDNHRPWGHYDVLSSGPDHKIKMITVAPGKRLSLQRHERRSEHWVIVRGKALATLDGRDLALSVGDHIFIATGSVHRIANPGTTPLLFAEVQVGDYFGEDDIVRYEDDFGRDL